MILSVFLVFKSFSKEIKPIFIYWNEIENKFDFKSVKYGKIPDIKDQILSESNYFDEFFIRTYLEKRFNISKTFVENYNNWCDCKDKDISISKMGIFNLNQKCYLCEFSDNNVYNLFKNNEYNAYLQLSESGITRNIKILDINILYGGESSSKTSFIDSIINSIIGKIKPIYVIKGYKIDFIIEEFKNNKLISQDVLVGYIDIKGLKDVPAKRIVTLASYMFNPNYDIVLKRYKESK